MQEKTVTVQLQYPVTLPDGKLTEITLRRPTLGDNLKCGQDGSVEKEVLLISLLTGLTREDLILLDMLDYRKLQDEILRFQGLDPEEVRQKFGV